MTRLATPLLTPFLAAALLVAVGAYAQAPADPDLSFGGTGKLHLGFGFAHDSGQDMALQPDGKIVVAGYCYNGERREVVVARYLTDGSLDPSFDGDGRAITSATPSLDPSYVAEDLGIAVALQPDGKIVVAGLSRSGPGGGNDFLVLRYESNGSLDVSFGDNGHVITDFGGGDDEAHAVALQADGKIVVAGSGSFAGDGKFAIVRYGTDGAPDPTFGSGGIVGAGNQLFEAAYGLAIQADGKIVATGFSVDAMGEERISVLRLDTTGAPDASFDGDGWVYTNTSPDFETGAAVALQPDPPLAERIVVAGGSGQSMVVLRYLQSGAPDPSFDTDGRTLVAGSPIGAQDVEVIASGGTPTHVLVCGSITVAGQPRFGAARFLVDGTPDGTFDGNGVLTTAIGATAGAGAVLALPGKVVLAGSSGSGTDTDLTIARYDDAGVLDPSFDGDGIRSDGFGNSLANGRAVAHQSDGAIVVAGNVSEALSSVQRIGVMRLLPDGMPDPSFGGKGTVTTDIAAGSEIVGGVAVQPDGKIVVAGTQSTPDNLNSDIAVLRYLPGGLLDPAFGGGDGIQLVNLLALDRAQAVALQADGKIVIAGWTSNYSNTNIAVARFGGDGTPDPGFGTGGIVTLDLSSDDRAFAVAIQPDGKIVIAGQFNGVSYVARLGTTGGLDPTFGDGGIADPVIGFAGDGAASLAIQPDGMIVVGGWRNLFGSETDAVVFRLDSNGVLDPGFDGDGMAFAAIGSQPNNRANGVAIQANGSIVLASPGTDAGPRTDFAVAAFEPGGAFDEQFAPSGRVLHDFVLGSSDLASAVAVDAQGRIVLVGQASGLFGVARLLGMQALTDVPEAPGAGRPQLRLLGAHPFSGRTQVEFELAHAGSIRLDVYDVSGAHVRTLSHGVWPAGRHHLEWDGADATGASAPAGIYFVRLAREGGSATAKAVRIR